ncbi:MAG: prephenate dehydrogenase [Bowdeniella nasicola]|nr:prephenate dehydrogenase [Bowdeniella nasicola]
MRVRVVGAGLLGASLGLALTSEGHDVSLDDTSPLALSLAAGLGAGTRATATEGEEIDLVVVATPPDVTADVVCAELDRCPGAVITDVASVKSHVIDTVLASGQPGLERFVGAHPMAGKERSGAPNADGDLFRGRPFVVVPTEHSSRTATERVTNLAVEVGAMPIIMSAAEHDDAVAAVSHLPQVVSSLLAARLQDVPEGALDLSGQGLRDTTRIAKSDPMLWATILAANAPRVRAHLAPLQRSLQAAISYLDTCATSHYPPAAVAGLAALIEAGSAGVARIPGKHGGAQRAYAEIVVYVPDRPGELARLFADVGEAGVNIEDVRLEHAAAAAVGLATISVDPAAGDRLTDYLSEREWSVVQR